MLRGWYRGRIVASAPARVAGGLALALCASCGEASVPARDASAEADATTDAADARADRGRDGGDGCPPALGEPAPRGEVDGVRHPMDDVLRVNHLQAEGTHNSYHVAPDDPIDPWAYTHAPLGEQLQSQGVRAVELDIWLDRSCERYEVFHAAVADEETTCWLMTDCLEALRAWSDANPGHHPIFVQIEPKDVYRESTAELQIEAMEREILSVWPRELIVTPDEVRGDRASVAEAIERDGWPTLGEVRGHALFFMNRGDTLRDDYTRDRTSLEGRVMFAEAAIGEPVASVMVINSPQTSADAIRGAVEAGYLVRTRADADGEEARAEDRTRLEAALASGAHIVSTDFPAPVEGTSYFVEIPDGTPSRCNPLVAPDECTPEAIEDPSLIAP